MEEGQLKKRIEENKFTPNTILEGDDDYLLDKEEVELWIDEAKKEFPKAWDFHIGEKFGDTYFRLKKQREDWFLKWFGEVKKSE
jgi:hypothetical protein